MNLIYREIGEEAQIPMARVHVRGVLTKVVLALTPDVRPGDRLLVYDGVALNKVFETNPQ